MRAQSHILETIACRTFERKLSEVIVVNPPLQGRDYGWDYQCTDFDAAGEITREFKAQVKHLAEIETVDPEHPTYLYQYHTTRGYRPGLAKYSLKSSQILTWMDSQKSPGPMLFVQADRERIVFAWLQDIYDFYLRWLPVTDQESHTVYLTDIRQLRDYNDLPTLWLDREPDCDGWIDARAAPGNVDAAFHMGLSLYLRCVHCGRRFLHYFDHAGFIEMLLDRADVEPHLMLAFAAFLGQLTPSDRAFQWAEGVAHAWDNPWHIPAAIQILSRSKKPSCLDALLNRFELCSPGGKGTWQIMRMVKPPWSEHADWRFGAEFNIAAGTFLERRIRDGNDTTAQQILVDCFREWDPTSRFPNFATTALESLLTKRELISHHESYRTLVRYAGLTGDPTPETLVENLREVDHNWRVECTSK